MTRLTLTYTFGGKKTEDVIKQLKADYALYEKFKSGEYETDDHAEIARLERNYKIYRGLISESKGEVVVDDSTRGFLFTLGLNVSKTDESQLENTVLKFRLKTADFIDYKKNLPQTSLPDHFPD